VSVDGLVPQPTFQPLRAALRPPRAAVVFPGGDHWLSNAALALYSCRQIWGGSGFLLIPHHDGKVSRSLRRLARAYDPDYVLGNLRRSNQVFFPCLLTASLWRVPTVRQRLRM
jgi:hypothetical protein